MEIRLKDLKKQEQILAKLATLPHAVNHSDVNLEFSDPPALVEHHD